MKKIIRRITRSCWYRRTRIFFKRHTIRGLHGSSIYDVTTTFYRNLVNSDTGLISGALAFNFFLAIFPGFLFLFTLIPYIPVNGIQDKIMTLIAKMMPAEGYSAVFDVIDSVVHNERGDLLSFGFLSAVYFSSRAVEAAVTAFQKENKRGLVRMKLLSVTLTFTLGLVSLIAIALILIAQVVVSAVTSGVALPAFITDTADLLFITDAIEFVKKYSDILNLSGMIIAALLILLAVMTLYYFGARPKQPFFHMLFGAVMATGLIMAFSYGFAWYVNHFGDYNKFYGSLGVFIVILLWLKLNAQALVIGYDFNYSIYQAKQMNDQRRKQARQYRLLAVRNDC